MMKKLITSVVLLGTSLWAVAQQDAQFSQNMFGKLDYNPGYAGMDKAYCASLIARDQWVNFPGNPETFLFNGDAYIPQIGGGAGISIYDDQLGFQKTLEVKLSYSYHIVVGSGVLGVGPTLGFLQTSLNGAWIAPDGSPNGQDDPLIPGGGSSATTYDLGLGAYYATPQGLYVGISSTHLSAPNVAGSGSDTKNYVFDVARHYYVMAGYTYNASPTWDIKPDLYLESDASSTQFQIDCLAEYNKLIWFGLGYRLQDAGIAFLGLNYAFKDKMDSNLKIGYSYDFTTSEIKSYSSGSHELMLQFCFRPKITPKTHFHQNVRYL
ncbi:MAG TPA: type IX secretion system membrane protein PorP/SprF [Bacteroidia bacterium]|nr:type IX secretion system membrane protein PorP/SprF [Bacteroidia bacterium]